MVESTGPEVNVLRALSETARRHWQGILGVTALCGVVAAVTVLVIPERFRSYGQLIPDMSGPTLGGLSGLASLAGRIGLTAAPVGLTPDYYASLITSRATLEVLARVRIDSAGEFGDVGRTMAEVVRVTKKDSLRRLEKTIEVLQRRTHVTVDGKTGIITASIDLASPHMAQRALQLLLRGLCPWTSRCVRPGRLQSVRIWTTGRYSRATPLWQSRSNSDCSTSAIGVGKKVLRSV
jgi:uncharacterized protein involved in exopolysaccharide biosynthesis